MTKALGVLALLGSSTAMAATVTITPSAALVTPGQTFTMTITGDMPNTVSGTMALAFDATRVAYVSGAALAPWNVFVKNSPVTANPTVFDVETPTATPASNPVPYNIAVLTFQALANAPGGSAGIVINDDGGNATGFFNSDANDPFYIPTTYTQGNVTVDAAVVPAPATLGLLATGLAGLVLRARRKRAA